MKNDEQNRNASGASLLNDGLCTETWRGDEITRRKT